MMRELEEIMNFAIPKIQKTVAEGAEIYESVESTVDVSPIGLSPLYKDEGYVFILETTKKNMKIFRYSLKIFESPSDNYRGIETKLMDELPYIKFKNLENDKLMLVKKYKDLPNPATYLLTSKGSFPFEETLMPVAKRFLVRYISST
jgi:NifB/MoaA-like Fe-S oxidoreductase